MLSNEVNDLSAILHEIRLVSLAGICNNTDEHELRQNSLAQNMTFATQRNLAKGQVLAVGTFVKALTKQLRGSGQPDVDIFRWA